MRTLGTHIVSLKNILSMSLGVLFITTKNAFLKHGCMNFVTDGLWNKLDILQDLIRQTCEEGCLLVFFFFSLVPK